MGVHDGPVDWSPPHGGPSSRPASLTSGLGFLGLFSYLAWCAMRTVLSKCKCRNAYKPEGREVAFGSKM